MADLRARQGASLRVAIVGGGVIGLSCALELRAAGHEVTVIARDPLELTTSARAGAVWFPFHAAPIDRVLGWGERTRMRLAALAADPATGIRLQVGRVLHRTPDPDLGWTAVVPDAITTFDPALLPSGVAAATTAELPVVDMTRYLPWLLDECDAVGVRSVNAELSTLDEAFAHGELVVIAAGLDSGTFADDASMVPIRGQIVRLANPGYDEWTLDYDNPAGLTYIIPRIDDVVCGGTDEVGDGSLAYDPMTEAGILERVRALAPELADAPVVSRAVGLRPGRSEVRVELTRDHAGRPVIHCYGHGGAGVTLSWGSAEEVAALAART